MSIYYDPTEARPGTRVPKDFFIISSALGNLEHYTGADFLITPHKLSMPIIKDIPPMQKALERNCLDGLLVQRKSGSDLLQSIPRLAHIQARMAIWSGNPILLVTGVWFSQGKIKVFGRKPPNWSASQVRGALLAWRLRGGSVIEVSTDKDISPVMSQLERKVQEYYTDPQKTIVNKTYTQALTLKAENWINSFRAWPKGITRKQLIALATHLAKQLDTEPSLINALALAISPKVLSVPSWGKKSHQKVIDWAGSLGIFNRVIIQLNKTELDESISHPELTRLKESGFVIEKPIFKR